MAKKEKPALSFNVAKKVIEEPKQAENDAIGQVEKLVAVKDSAVSTEKAPDLADFISVNSKPAEVVSVPGTSSLNTAQKDTSESTGFTQEDLMLLRKGFIVRLTPVQLKKMNTVFNESKFKSKQKMVEALLMLGIENLSKELGLS